MYCPNCGKELNGDAVFCSACGTRQNQPAPEAQEQPVHQEEIAQPVPQEAPVPPAAEAPREPKPIAPVKKKKSRLPVIILGVVALIAVIVAVVLVFGKQTVYLSTESTSTSSSGITNITRWEYDDEGRLLSWEYITKYPDTYPMPDQVKEIQYEYDDGRIVSASLEFDSGYEKTSAEVEYIYDKKGVLEDVEVSTESSHKYEFDFTDDGKFERIEVSDEGGLLGAYEFTYHDNGRLESMEYLVFGSHSIKSVYDEQGRQVENTIYYNGVRQSKVINVYEGDSQYFTEMIQIYGEGDEEQTATIRIETEKKGGKATAMTMYIINETADGEETEISLYGEIEWDDTEGVWKCEKVDGDTDKLDDVDLDDVDLEDMEIEFAMDRTGNLLSTEITLGGTEVMSSESEWEAFKVPRDYVKPSTIDPMYSLDWIVN